MYGTFLKLLQCLIFIPIFLFFTEQSKAIDRFPADLETGEICMFRLNNGDVLSGEIAEFGSDEKLGDYLKIKTELGKAVIYSSQVASVIRQKNYNRHTHRIFIQPTAEPIGENHFIGFWEIALLYGGFGISDIASFTFGRTLVPAIPASDQGSVLNGKLTFYKEYFETMEGSMSFAVGSNLAFLNHNNRLIHYYAAASFTGSRTLLNMLIYYKAGSKDIYKLFLSNTSIDMIYEDGAFGIGLGIATRFSKWRDLYFIGELWHSNIKRSQHTGLLLGLRLANSQFSADFGIGLTTQFYAAPFVSFSWTPF